MDRAGSIGTFLDSIPGYRGYRRKEDRRDADRIVREQIATDLDQRATRIDRVAANLAAKRDLSNLGPLNALTQELRLLATRVRTASYGYGGLFGNKDINDAALAQIRAFDETLLEGVTALDEPIATLEKATVDTLPAAADAAKAIVLHLSGQFDARASVVETAEPSTIEPALPPVGSTLDKQEPVKPHPAYELHDRDALEILGDSGVIDARMDINEPRPLRMFRIAGTPKRWLLVPKDPTGEFALLEEVEVEAESADSTTINGVAFTASEPVKASGSVVGAGGEQRDLPVTLTSMNGATDPSARAMVLDWSGERQVFAGSTVHPDDIEIYGSTLN